LFLNLSVAGVGVFVMAEVEASVKPKRPTWSEHLALEKRISLISEKVADLYKDVKILPGESKADLEAKKAKFMEEQVPLVREYLRIVREKGAPDFSGMSEADRAAEAERLRQEALAEARRLQIAGDPEGLWREGAARVLDFDPKQGGTYRNRCYFGELRFDHDEECKPPFIRSNPLSPPSSGPINLTN
jgi:hypothetical protein